MKKKFLLFLGIFAFGFSSKISAQNTAESLLLLHRTVKTSNDFAFRARTEAPASAEYVDGYAYRLVQFEKMPTSEQKMVLAQEGVLWLDYVPYNAFVLALPMQFEYSRLSDFGAKTALILRGGDKISPNIRVRNIPPHAIVGNRFEVSVVFWDNIIFEKGIVALAKKGFEIVQRDDVNKSVVCHVKFTDIERIADMPNVRFVDFTPEIPTPDDLGGRSLGRSNWLDNGQNGLNFKGEGETIVIADDGIVGPHIDFQGRLRHRDSVSNVGDHGDMTAGCAGGAGNLNPRFPGTAPGANLVIYDIGNYAHIAQAVANQTTYNSYLTSTSYTQGCNAYNNLAEQIDNQLFANQNIMHFFSAGNSSATYCDYGGTKKVCTYTITAADTTVSFCYGNITGGMKLGKNPIATANIQPTDIITTSSSRGPAIDGRIKPDLSATGNGQTAPARNNTTQAASGTSAASPTLAGTAAQLMQAYRSLNNNQRPNGAMLKAVMLNSADDVGTDGPDFTFGWGRVNAKRAYQTFVDRRFMSETIRQDSVKRFPLTVPQGTGRVKVMIYWAERAGSTVSQRALVNDLDLRIVNANNPAQVWQPWVLSTFPMRDSLAKAATRGTDRINNMEQVQIDSPSVSNLIAEVRGFAVPDGTQEFWFTYEFMKDSIELTHPMGGEQFVPGTIEYIRWEALNHNTVTNATLEYSTDNGATWQIITTGAQTNRRYQQWTVPSAATSNALVRMTANGQTVVSPRKFTILASPASLAVQYVCPDSTTLTWSAVPNATKYIVYKLGAKYMDSIAETPNTRFVVPIRGTDSAWFSVAAKLPDGGISMRAVAIPKPRTLLCPATNDMEMQRITNTIPAKWVACRDGNTLNLSVLVRNYGLNPVDSFEISYTVNGQTPVQQTIVRRIASLATTTAAFTTPINLTTDGTYTIIAKVRILNDEVPTNDSTRISFVFQKNAAAAPLIENFEATVFPPDGWGLVQSNTATTWQQLSNVRGSNGNFTKVAYYDNSLNTARGVRDALTSWLVDISRVQNPMLTFDVSYAAHTSGRSDILAVDVFKNCGSTNAGQVYYKRGTALASVPQTSANWQPTSAGDWRRDSIDLTPYRDSALMIRFSNICDNGGKLYLDNINIINRINTATNDPLSIPMMAAFPNPSETGVFDLNLKNFDTKSLNISIFDAVGRQVYEKKYQNGLYGNLIENIDLQQHSAGVYIINIATDNKNYQLKLTVL